MVSREHPESQGNPHTRMTSESGWFQINIDVNRGFPRTQLLLHSAVISTLYGKVVASDKKN